MDDPCRPVPVRPPGKRKRLGASRGLRFGPGYPLKPSITRGFEYADCAVDDARLVVLNAMAAREKGAHIQTRTRCLRAERSDGLWQVELQHADGSVQTIRARALVNAAGPWVASFIKDDLKLDAPYGIRLIQGSHLIVPRLYEANTPTSCRTKISASSSAFPTSIASP